MQTEEQAETDDDDYEGKFNWVEICSLCKNDLNLEYQRKFFGSLTIKNSICVAVSHKHHGSAHDDWYWINFYFYWVNIRCTRTAKKKSHEKSKNWFVSPTRDEDDNAFFPFFITSFSHTDFKNKLWSHFFVFHFASLKWYRAAIADRWVFIFVIHRKIGNIILKLHLIHDWIWCIFFKVNFFTFALIDCSPMKRINKAAAVTTVVKPGNPPRPFDPIFTSDLSTLILCT